LAVKRCARCLAAEERGLGGPLCSEQSQPSAESRSPEPVIKIGDAGQLTLKFDSPGHLLSFMLARWTTAQV